MKKLIAFLLAAVMCFSLAACGGTGDTGTTDDSGNQSSDAQGSKDGTASDTLTVAVADDPSTLAPSAIFDYACHVVTESIYERLVYQDNDGNMQYRAAESIEQEDDTHLIVNIRKGITDTLGNEFTAEDLLYDIEYTMNTPYVVTCNRIDLANCEIIDDYTVRLALTEPYALQVPIFSGMHLFDKDSFEASSDGMAMTPVGYGPYYLDSIVTGSEVILKARDDYWDGAPQYKTVVLKVMKEATQRTNALEAGEVDVAMNVALTDVDYINGIDGLSVCEVNTISSHGIQFNMSEDSPLNDIHLRKAICYAIDSDAIIQIGYEGHAGKPIAMFSTACSDYDEAGWNEIYEKYDDYYAFNLEKAKEEMALSAYPDGVTLQAIHYTNNNGDINSELVQGMLKEIGIDLVITAYDNATVTQMQSTETDTWDMSFTGWAARANYATAIADLHVANNNWFKWSGESYDQVTAAINKAQTSSIDDIKQNALGFLDLCSEYLPAYETAQAITMIGVADGTTMAFYATDYPNFAAMVG